MEKEKKFELEKFEVAKLKNLKKISGGYNTTIGNNGGNDNTVITTTGGTSQDQQHSNGICVV